MDDAAGTLLSVLSFGLDLVVNQPAFILPVPAAILASIGLMVVVFAATNDILKDFAGFGTAPSVVIALCMALIGFMFYLKNEALVLTICIFICLVIRVCEAATVGRALASPRGLLLMGLSVMLMIAMIISNAKSWLIEQRHLLVVWSAAHGCMAANVAARIQIQYGSLKNKPLLLVGFGFMIAAASITVPQNDYLNQLYLWLYPAALVLSFALSWRRKGRPSHAHP